MKRNARRGAGVVLAVFFAGPGVATAWAQAAPAATEVAPPAQRPDARLKMDLLLVTAHPDDDTLVAPYLARLVHDESRKVAVVVCNDGAGGGNAVGSERGAALGAVRRIEARRALGTLGIQEVWLLNGRDTASQNVLYSLANWGHGSVLEQVVRLVRLTRPEVMLTWLPRTVVGENHGDHQAAGVIATEAFDLAGDPAAFPAQISGMARPTEGLQPWQPKKLYYFADAFRTDFFRGRGPEYSLLERSRTKGVPYAHLALEATKPYATQMAGLLPPAARRALEQGKPDEAIRIVLAQEPTLVLEPLRFLLGRSHVPGEPTSDVFAGIMPGPAPFTPPPRQRRTTPSEVSLSLGGPWAFYPEFWRSHFLHHLTELGPPEMALRPGLALHLPLLIRNDSDQDQEVALVAVLPQGWRERPRPARFPVPAGSSYDVQLFLEAPPQSTADARPITYEARVGGRTVGTATLRVRLTADTMPQ